jgi:hypothetical protein
MAAVKIHESTIIRRRIDANDMKKNSRFDYGTNQMRISRLSAWSGPRSKRWNSVGGEGMTYLHSLKKKDHASPLEEVDANPVQQQFEEYLI